MTVARRPEDFAGGDAPPDGGEGWRIGGEIYDTNPKRLLTRDDEEMVRIWSWTRTGDMGGARPLPDRGGIQDQAAVMMDAIRIMDHQFYALSERDKAR